MPNEITKINLTTQEGVLLWSFEPTLPKSVSPFLLLITGFEYSIASPFGQRVKPITPNLFQLAILDTHSLSPPSSSLRPASKIPVAPFIYLFPVWR